MCISSFSWQIIKTKMRLWNSLDIIKITFKSIDYKMMLLTLFLIHYLSSSNPFKYSSVYKTWTSPDQLSIEPIKSLISNPGIS